ncbi:ATP-binding protein [Streptomyces sp. NPDC051636]|uniref:ATP-binding protein n=1 Tax=Streptomyces sp. NPDC051636 TaxID=3365663 RepID=UPI0037B59E92
MIPSAPLGTDAAADRLGLGAATGVAPGGGAAERRFRFELAAHPASPAQARRLARARLTGWSVCADTCDTAALVISELVTNAIVHTASSRVVCELHDHDDTVRIAVYDEGCAPGEPHPSPQRPEEEHGRGLLLVDAMCRAWGAQEHGPGLLVWAELPRKADHPCDDVEEPRNDLGWGARSAPVPPHGSGHGTRHGSGHGSGHGSAEEEQATARRGGADALGRIPHERDRSWGRL